MLMQVSLPGHTCGNCRLLKTVNPTLLAYFHAANLLIKINPNLFTDGANARKSGIFPVEF
jgi:hypothetical protein